MASLFIASICYLNWLLVYSDFNFHVGMMVCVVIHIFLFLFVALEAICHYALNYQLHLYESHHSLRVLKKDLQLIKFCN